MDEYLVEMNDLRRQIARLKFQRAEQTSRDLGYFIHCRQERSFVCLRRFVETGDFSYELERSSSNLFGGDWRFEVEKGPDISAHLGDLKTEKPQPLETLVGFPPAEKRSRLFRRS